MMKTALEEVAEGQKTSCGRCQIRERDDRAQHGRLEGGPSNDFGRRLRSESIDVELPWYRWC
jgi:hypothetical protein